MMTMSYVIIANVALKKKKNKTKGKKVGCSKSVPKAKKYLKKLHSLKENFDFDPQIIIDSVNSVLSELPDGHQHKNSRSANIILRKIYEILKKNNFKTNQDPDFLVQSALSKVKIF
mgnify:CR=1 FL=1